MTIAAAWERRDGGQNWHTDFTLTYTRIPTTAADDTAGGHDRRSTP
jgi:hypothetical protein